MNDTIIKAVIRTYYFGILLLVIGSILYLKGFNISIDVLCIGGGFLIIYYIVQVIFPPVKYDNHYQWERVYPELLHDYKGEEENEG